MFTANSIANTLSTIKNGYCAKKLYVDTPHCSANAQLLDQLRCAGYIQNYVVRDSVVTPARGALRARIYLKYVNQAPLFNSSRCYWQLRSRKIVTLTALKNLNLSSLSVTLLVLTDDGLLTNAECILRRKGGMLVCGLYGLIWSFQRVTPWLQSAGFFCTSIS